LRKHLLSVALAASVMVGCQHKEAVPAASSIEPLPMQSFKRDWSADLELKGDAITRVFLREDVVVAYTKSNMAFVLNRAGGVVRFAAKVTDSTIPPLEPVILKERVIFPTDSTLEIYHRDGRFERSYKTQSSPRTNVVGQRDGSRVFFGVDAGNSGRLVAIETLPGQYKPVNQKWELMSDHGAPIYSAPAVNAGIVYAAFADGEIYAVNQDNRQAIWSTSTGQTFKTYGPVQADLRADEFGVYVPSTDSKFYCLDKTQGKVKWEYFAGSSLRSTPAISATMVYLPVTDRGVVAIDKINGPAVREPKWIVRDAVKLVAEDEKYAYFHRADNVVIAIDKASGEQKFTSKRTDFVAFATNTKDSTIYAATKGGQVMAIVPVLKPGNMGELALDQATPVEMDRLAMR
jgi:outer membrane protein assembly factor BamB